MARRPVPVRTCVACRSARPKRELVRVVRTTAGAVEVDPTGKKAGRGAYLCRAQVCWSDAFRRQALERALKCELPASDRQVLEQFVATLPPELG